MNKNITFLNFKKITLLFVSMFGFVSFSFASHNNFADLSPALAAQTGSYIVSPKTIKDLNPAFNREVMVRWAGNQKFIYYMPSKDQSNEGEITLYDIKTKQSVLLTQGETPIPSPNGQWIAFTKKSDNENQLWIINLKSREIKPITHLKNGLIGEYGTMYNYIWSPDSKKIALTHQDTDSYSTTSPPPPTIVDMIDVADAHAKIIASIDAQLFDLSWIPNSKKIMYSKTRVGEFYRSLEDRVWLQTLNVENGQTQDLHEFLGLQQTLRPQASSDGKIVALTYDAHHPSFNFLGDVALISIDADTNKNPISLKQITTEAKFDFLQWAPNNKSILALRYYGPYAQLYKINIKSGQAVQITNDALNITIFALSPNAKHLVWIGNDVHGNNILKLRDIRTGKTQNLFKTQPISTNTALSEVREIEWKSNDYPNSMRGLLVLPLNYIKNQRYPLIVDIHGGDVGANLNRILVGGLVTATPLEWQIWAAKGYAVFVPEFRSSGAFGSLAIDNILLNHDRLNDDLNDIESGVTYLINEGIADSDRLAIFGHSAGGLRANWFAVASHRYKAIVSHEGWADELEDALKYPPSQRVYDFNGGTPQEVPENYKKNSPYYFVSNATTPTLLMMGNPELGGVDPHQTVLKFHHALKLKGIETQFIEYEDEGHTINKPENRVDALQKVIEWMDKHLK